MGCAPVDFLCLKLHRRSDAFVTFPWVNVTKSLKIAAFYVARKRACVLCPQIKKLNYAWINGKVPAHSGAEWVPRAATRANNCRYYVAASPF
jgi:hypothetical protein